MMFGYFETCDCTKNMYVLLPKYCQSESADKKVAFFRDLSNIYIIMQLFWENKCILTIDIALITTHKIIKWAFLE